MKVIEVENANRALSIAIPYLLNEGIREESRNGTVLVSEVPVCTIYRKPRQRVVFSPERDANPFFHLMEALWMLAGRDDLDWPVQFNKRFKEFSDDGAYLHGAYGFRWRRFFMFDQLDEIVEHLRKFPNSRRAVLEMWSAEGDLVPHQLRAGAYGYASKGGTESKDVPCNTHAYFSIRGDNLNMTVCNRSNDVIWGAYGANIVHFSMLQEYLAKRLGLFVGKYYQISNNFHAYTDIYGEEKLQKIADDCLAHDYYNIWPEIGTRQMPIISTPDEEWKEDLDLFLEGEKHAHYKDPFLNTVARAMYEAWFARKQDDIKTALTKIETMPFCDWKIAARQWIERRSSVRP